MHMADATPSMPGALQHYPTTVSLNIPQHSKMELSEVRVLQPDQAGQLLTGMQIITVLQTSSDAERTEALVRGQS
jgi:hypothetical protein